jgi:hypothetical protein
MAVKKDLTFEERIEVSFAHFCLGVEQHTLAAMKGVNGARVNEACQAIKMAAKDPKKVRPNYGKKKK